MSDVIIKSGLLPGNDQAGLWKKVLEQRLESAESALKVAAEIHQDAAYHDLIDELLKLANGKSDWKPVFFFDPEFFVWTTTFSRAVHYRDADRIRLVASRLPAVAQTVFGRSESLHWPTLEKSKLVVQSRLSDPFIMSVTPPTHDFMTDAGALTDVSPAHLYAELIGNAWRNIKAAWPDMATSISQFTRIVCHLPHVTFRSCSAARYSGLTYFGDMDEHILDIEENLVHENGHQVLYKLGEISSLVTEKATKEPIYTLPWSGSKRDLFGYFHAFYIYVLLTDYFDRRSDDTTLMGRVAGLRARGLVPGNRAAYEELREQTELSEQSIAILDTIEPVIARLEDSLASATS